MNQQERPNPDAILASMREEEINKQKGRLKIFFGMCAGVGKTYAMLKAAQGLKAKGIHIVAGLAETHGRKETEALLEGLSIIPKISIDYRNVQIQEMDLDAILHLKPEYVIVDELAHTNTTGMRHSKRYQDVQEILEKGINVYTTLNVQHIESLVDTVEQISHVAVRETVPDSIMDAADEIELIDLSPEELLERLAEGKVYAPDRAVAATDNFFRKGNLTALREIALRKTAQRVDLQLKDYMDKNRISGPWKTVERLMVGVGPSPYSEQLIRWTRRIASTMEAPWIAVYVQTSQLLTADAEKRLKKNIALAQELGATLVTTTDDNVARALIREAGRNNVTQIVVGKSMSNPFMDLIHRGSLVSKLIHESGGIDIYVVQSDMDAAKNKHKIKIEFPVPQSSLRQYFLSCALVVIAALACFVASSFINYRAVGMFLLFIVSILSLFSGRGPILIASILSAVTWDYFFIPPLYTFSVSQPSDVLLLILFLAVALVSGTLTSRVKKQERAVRFREQYTAALYSLVNELSSVESVDEIANASIANIGRIFESRVSFYLAAGSDEINSEPHAESTFKPDSPKEHDVAEWVFKNKKTAGKGTDTLPFAQAVYYPLLLNGNCSGVIGLVSSPGHELPFDKEGLLQMFLHQISLALERIHLRSERLNKTLLNSISHELRTPLATITGAAGGLLDHNTSSDPKARKILIDDINSAASRLNRLVKNLLDMTRIESGALIIFEDWCDVHDLFNSVINNLHNELADHKIRITVPQDMPLIKLDTVLIEQALTNIILNAAQYTPVNTNILLTTHYESGILTFSVEDEGPGIPPESLNKIFDKFYRTPGSKSGGTGLGLSIVKGLVEFHRGTAKVQNRPQGGAQFIIHLPVAQKVFSAKEVE